MRFVHRHLILQIAHAFKVALDGLALLLGRRLNAGVARCCERSAQCANALGLALLFGQRHFGVGEQLLFGLHFAFQDAPAGFRAALLVDFLRGFGESEAVSTRPDGLRRRDLLRGGLRLRCGCHNRYCSRLRAVGPSAAGQVGWDACAAVTDALAGRWRAGAHHQGTR